MCGLLQTGEVFTDELQAAVHSGPDGHLPDKIDLVRSAAVWFDRTSVRGVTATVRYDNLTRRYPSTRTLDGRIERADQTEREEAVPTG